MSLQFENIILEHEGPVAWIRLNRPDALNAFADNMRDELLHALMDAQQREDNRVVVITGVGRAFCAGGDVKRMVELKAEASDFGPVRANMESGASVVRLIYEMGRPVIAMVNGIAAGAGCNLALACDLRVAGESAKFVQSFVKVGLHPDWGGSYFLPRIVGSARALELLWTGRTVEAEEAASIGLVNRLLPQAQLEDATRRLAQQLADAPASVLRLCKLAVDQSGQFDLEGMLEFEMEGQAHCWAAPESGEGLRAFAEKRKPDFRR
jgi:2-(1,2-epoxy-1,2-dihydrophenyl)acetyl-CoA isomerase